MTATDAPTTALKRCPNCAEVVQRDARACRYCGHSFTRRARPPVWFTASAIVIVATVAVLVGFHGLPGHNHAPQNLPSLEQDIQSRLPGRLRRTLDNRSIRVTSVRCIAPSKNSATCIAAVTDAQHEHLDLRVAADFDSSSGTYIWRVASP